MFLDLLCVFMSAVALREMQLQGCKLLLNTHTHSHTLTHTHTHSLTHIHTLTNTLIHTLIHTQTHKYTYTVYADT